MKGENPFETRPCEYDAWFDLNENVYRSELLAIEELLPEKKGTWVEIGVGSGRFASKLGIDIGIEPADGIASLARERGVEVKKGVAEDLPLADGSAHAAFMITSLCFIEDMGRALAEVERVLVPGGAAIIAFIPREIETAGLRIDRCVGTLTGDPAGANERVEPPTEGCDEGSFIVVRAVKPSS